MRVLLVAALVYLAAAHFLLDGIHYKNPAGPPSEFGDYVLPTPIETALSSASTSYDIELDATTNSWSVSIPIDSVVEFSIGISSPMADKFTVTVKSPSGSSFEPISQVANVILNDNLGVDGAQFPVTTYLFAGDVSGVWQVNIVASSLTAEQKASLTDDIPEGLLIAGSTSQYQSFAHLTDLADLLDSNIGMQVRLYDTTVEVTEGEAPAAVLRASTISANALIVNPDGSYEDLPMHDDGLHADGAANDGVFGVEVQIGEVGYYSARITIGGEIDGLPFSRSTDHIFYAVADTVDVFGTATATVDSAAGMLDINVDAKVQTFDNIATPGLYKIYGEFWGMGTDGKQVPIAWLGGLAPLFTTLDGDSSLSLELALDWIHHADASAPFYIKNFRVQDAETSTPLDLNSQIVVSVSLEDIEALHTVAPRVPKGTISQEMRHGRVPAHIVNATRGVQSGEVTGKLVLLHGYCADSNPWPTSDFPGALFYAYGKAVSLTHLAFAQDVVKYMENQGLTAASGIGHSQGGPVLVTMLGLMWTPLDASFGQSGKVVQSVGSPYKGCTLAGGLAGLGSIFGTGCGSNSDLSTQGATTWLSGVPSADRQAMTYYYTIYGSAGYCNSIVNWVANLPNDGTTEEKYAALPDATLGQKITGYCHIDDMQYPAQTGYSANNKAMCQKDVWCGK